MALWDPNRQEFPEPGPYIPPVSVFKEIDLSSTYMGTSDVSYTHYFTTASTGINSINIVSGSINDNYWQSLNVLFYTSGSPEYINEHKFGRPGNNINISRLGGTKHLHKFHGYPSSSILTVPQQYYGQKIKEKTFKFKISMKSNLLT